MSTVTNISQAAVGGLSNSVGAYEQKQMWISNVVSHQFSFSRFMSGIHKRVGQVRKPDKEMSIKVLHAAMQSWRKNGLVPGPLVKRKGLRKWGPGLWVDSARV
jgi:hypothetical protein